MAESFQSADRKRRHIERMARGKRTASDGGKSTVRPGKAGARKHSAFALAMRGRAPSVSKPRQFNIG
jgi:hypothetical protein